jgi:hypothetical protein
MRNDAEAAGARRPRQCQTPSGARHLPGAGGPGHDRERVRAKWGTDVIVEYADNGNRDMGSGSR